MRIIHIFNLSLPPLIYLPNQTTYNHSLVPSNDKLSWKAFGSEKYYTKAVLFIIMNESIFGSWLWRVNRKLLPQDLWQLENLWMPDSEIWRIFVIFFRLLSKSGEAKLAEKSYGMKSPAMSALTFIGFLYFLNLIQVWLVFWSLIANLRHLYHLSLGTYSYTRSQNHAQRLCMVGWWEAPWPKHEPNKCVVPSGPHEKANSHDGVPYFVEFPFMICTKGVLKHCQKNKRDTLKIKKNAAPRFEPRNIALVAPPLS